MSAETNACISYKNAVFYRGFNSYPYVLNTNTGKIFPFLNDNGDILENSHELICINKRTSNKEISFYFNTRNIEGGVIRYDLCEDILYGPFIVERGETAKK